VVIGDPSHLGVDGYRVGRVLLEMDPSQLQLEDFDPSSPEYAELCAVKDRPRVEHDIDSNDPADPAEVCPPNTSEKNRGHGDDGCPDVDAGQHSTAGSKLP